MTHRRPTMPRCEVATGRATARPMRQAFTIIELLVVLGIIAILVTLSITVGREVTRGGEDRITRDMIRILDMTLTSWYADKEAKFPAYLTGDYDPGIPGVGGTGGEPQFPIIDGRDRDNSPPGATEPTLAAFLIIASESASVEKTLKQQIDVKYLGSSSLRWTYGATASIEGASAGLTVLDAWGRPIRFVHPMWHGGYGEYVDPADGSLIQRPAREVRPRGHNEVRYSRSYRSSSGAVGDSDEGLCPGNRPYFYSAGRDQNPGTIQDNVYTNVPSFPPETAKRE